MSLRYCLPRVHYQDNGLEGELVPWARAFLAAQVLDATLLAPAFAPDRRRFWGALHASPRRSSYQPAMARLLPKIEFKEADYLEHGGGDVIAALSGFSRAHQLQRRAAFVFTTAGAWGGWQHVRAARDFMRSTLCRSGHAAQNLLCLRERIDADRIVVGMHLGSAGFNSPLTLDEHRGAVGTAPPLGWYRSIARSLRQGLGHELQFLLVSDHSPAIDGTLPSLQPMMLEGLPCITMADLPQVDCSQVLALLAADLLVCSGSAYGDLAAFLSDAPYLWFAPQRRAQDLDSRGVAVDLDGAVPGALVARLRERHARRRWEHDLVRGGVIADGAAEAR